MGKANGSCSVALSDSQSILLPLSWSCEILAIRAMLWCSRGENMQPVGLQRQQSWKEQKSLNSAIANGPWMQKKDGGSLNCSRKQGQDQPQLYTHSSRTSCVLDGTVPWQPRDGKDPLSPSSCRPHPPLATKNRWLKNEFKNKN